jgi:hypothetical protein
VVGPLKVIDEGSIFGHQAAVGLIEFPQDAFNDRGQHSTPFLQQQILKSVYVGAEFLSNRLEEGLAVVPGELLRERSTKVLKGFGVIAGAEQASKIVSAEVQHGVVGVHPLPRLFQPVIPTQVF